MSKIYNIPESIKELAIQLEELDLLLLDLPPVPENSNIPNQIFWDLRAAARRGFHRAKKDYRKKLVRKIRYRAQKLNETR